jgi:hypothetical protein
MKLTKLQTHFRRNWWERFPAIFSLPAGVEPKILGRHDTQHKDIQHTLSKKTLSIKTLSIKTLNIKTLSIKTFSITTISIMGLVTTLSIDIQHNSIECHYAECRYAECRDYLNVMLSAARLNVVMLSVVAPLELWVRYSTTVLTTITKLA